MLNVAHVQSQLIIFILAATMVPTPSMITGTTDKRRQLCSWWSTYIPNHDANNLTESVKSDTGHKLSVIICHQHVRHPQIFLISVPLCQSNIRNILSMHSAEASCWNICRCKTGQVSSLYMSDILGFCTSRPLNLWILLGCVSAVC